MRHDVHGIVADRSRPPRQVVADAPVRQPLTDEPVALLTAAERGTGDHQLERRSWGIETVPCAIEPSCRALPIRRYRAGPLDIALLGPGIACRPQHLAGVGVEHDGGPARESPRGDAVTPAARHAQLEPD